MKTPTTHKLILILLLFTFSLKTGTAQNLNPILIGQEGLTARLPVDLIFPEYAYFIKNKQEKCANKRNTAWG